MKLILASLISIAAYGQATINAPAVTLDANGSSAVTAFMSVQTTGVSTTLAAPVLVGDTTITLSSGAGFGAASAISINGEHMQVTAKAGAVLTVTRGVNGTTAAAQANGATVVEMKYKTINALGKAIIVDKLQRVARDYLNAAVLAAAAASDASAMAAVQ
jgi:hypothetical protein